MVCLNKSLALIKSLTSFRQQFFLRHLDENIRDNVSLFFPTNKLSVIIVQSLRKAFPTNNFYFVQTAPTFPIYLREFLDARNKKLKDKQLFELDPSCWLFLFKCIRLEFQHTNFNARRDDLQDDMLLYHCDWFIQDIAKIKMLFRRNFLDYEKFLVNVVSADVEVHVFSTFAFIFEQCPFIKLNQCISSTSKAFVYRINEKPLAYKMRENTVPKIVWDFELEITDTAIKNGINFFDEFDEKNRFLSFLSSDSED